MRPLLDGKTLIGSLVFNTIWTASYLAVQCSFSDPTPDIGQGVHTLVTNILSFTGAHDMICHGVDFESRGHWKEEKLELVVLCKGRHSYVTRNQKRRDLPATKVPCDLGRYFVLCIRWENGVARGPEAQTAGYAFAAA
jgi:hypothetical protein